MGSAAGNGQAVHPGLLHKSHGFLRLCVQRHVASVQSGGLAYMTQLALHCQSLYMTQLHRLFSPGNVLLHVIGRGIHHDGGKSLPVSPCNFLPVPAMVQNQGHRHIGLFCQGLNHGNHQLRPGVLCHLGLAHEDNERRLHFICCRYKSPGQLHIKCGCRQNSIVVFICIIKNCFDICIHYVLPLNFSISCSNAISRYCPAPASLSLPHF